MNTSPRILPYLIFFVIFLPTAISAQVVKSTVSVGRQVNIVKDARFAAGWQAGRSISEGLEIGLPSGLFIGAAALVTLSSDSPLENGVYYPGSAALGGSISLGYLRSTIGVSFNVLAHFAQYLGTDLYYVYPAVELSPLFVFSPLPGTAVRLATPAGLAFRPDLQYHILVGIQLTVEL